MKWLLKNIGLMALGACVLASAASLEMRLNSIEANLLAATKGQRELAKIGAALPLKTLASR